MPKTSRGTFNIAQLKKCLGVSQRHDYVRYGRALTTTGGQMVTEWRRLNDIGVKQSYLEEFLPDLKVLPRFAVLVPRVEKIIASQRENRGKSDYSSIEHEKNIKDTLQGYVLRRAEGNLREALSNWDANFFDCVAEAIRAVRGTQPVDPVRATLLDIAFVFRHYQGGKVLVHKHNPDDGLIPDYYLLQEIESYLHLDEMVQLLHRRMPQRKRDYDAREVRRWCSELGIRLLKGKPGRRRGDSNRWGGK